MSATNTHPAAYPFAWLQPVRYDLDEYRQFVAALDGDLADLVAEYAPSRPLHPFRSGDLERDAGVEPNLPPGQSSC